MTVHREGYVPLLITAVALIVLNLLVIQFLAWAPPWPIIVHLGSTLLFLMILQFFRNPKVNTPLDDHKVYAPANGKVVVIEETYEQEYFNETRKQISIFMSPVDVHVNRNPVSGIIKKLKHHEGNYLVAWHPKSSLENERTTLVVEAAQGVDVLIRQIAGAVARRIKCYVDEGDSVIQGEEFGFIKFGSRVDVFLPLDAQINVSIGEKTIAGNTVIAHLSFINTSK